MGATQADYVRASGITANTASRWYTGELRPMDSLRVLDVLPVRSHAKGLRKLSAGDARCMRELYGMGVGVDQLARLFFVHENTARRAARGYTYKEVR